MKRGEYARARLIAVLLVRRRFSPAARKKKDRNVAFAVSEPLLFRRAHIVARTQNNASHVTIFEFFHFLIFPRYNRWKYLSDIIYTYTHVHENVCVCEICICIDMLCGFLFRGNGTICVRTKIGTFLRRANKPAVRDVRCVSLTSLSRNEYFAPIVGDSVLICFGDLNSYEKVRHILPPHAFSYGNTKALSLALLASLRPSDIFML